MFIFNLLNFIGTCLNYQRHAQFAFESHQNQIRLRWKFETMKASDLSHSSLLLAQVVEACLLNRAILRK